MISVNEDGNNDNVDKHDDGVKKMIRKWTKQMKRGLKLFDNDHITKKVLRVGNCSSGGQPK